MRRLLHAIHARWQAYWRKALDLVDGGTEMEILRARRIALQREAYIAIRHAHRVIQHDDGR